MTWMPSTAALTMDWSLLPYLLDHNLRLKASLKGLISRSEEPNLELSWLSSLTATLGYFFNIPFFVKEPIYKTRVLSIDFVTHNLHWINRNLIRARRPTPPTARQSRPRWRLLLIISCIFLSIPSSTPRGGIAFTTFYLSQRVSQQKTKPMDWLSFLWPLSLTLKPKHASTPDLPRQPGWNSCLYRSILSPSFFSQNPHCWPLRFYRLVASRTTISS